MTLGEKVAQRLKQRGETQSSLAKAIGVRPSTISELVNNETKNPTWDLMVQVARHLACPLDHFVSTTDAPKLVREAEIADWLADLSAQVRAVVFSRTAKRRSQGGYAVPTDSD